MIGIDTRRRCHIQTFRRFQIIAIMNAYKGAGCTFCQIGAVNAGGTMRLVTDHQIKGRRTHLLCLMNNVNRLIGAEHNRHAVGGLTQGTGNAMGICRGRKDQIFNSAIFGCAINLCIRTDSDIAMILAPLK